jgi:general stress protein 26
MSDLARARTEPEALLWTELEGVRAGMLGVEGSSDHMQPMAHHVDRAGGRLWFLTKRDTELAEHVATGARAHFVIISKSHDFHACMSGTIAEDHNEAFLDKLWNPVVASWYEQGRDDPQLMMLAMTLEDADIWASTSSSLAFAWEVAKANLTQSTPDVGVRNHVSFG